MATRPTIQSVLLANQWRWAMACVLVAILHEEQGKPGVRIDRWEYYLWQAAELAGVDPHAL